MTYYYFTNELYHHGIKGQKWGVRRYQYKDMSYTPEGAERYNHRNSDGSIKGSHSSEKKSKIDKKAVAKKVAIGAGILAGTALAIYGGKKFHDLNPDFVKNAKKAVSDEIQRLRMGESRSEAKTRREHAQYVRDRLEWEKGDKKSPPPIPSKRVNEEIKNRSIQNAKSTLEDIKDPEKRRYYTNSQIEEYRKLAKSDSNDLKVTGLNVKLKGEKDSLSKIATTSSEKSIIDRIPKAEVKRTEVPRTEVKRTEIPKTEVKRTEVQRTDPRDILKKIQSFNVTKIEIPDGTDDLVKSMLSKNKKTTEEWQQQQNQQETKPKKKR